MSFNSHDSNDEFGDFEATPPLTSTSSVDNNQKKDEFDFGDFTISSHQPSSTLTSTTTAPPTVAPATEDLFDFGSNTTTTFNNNKNISGNINNNNNTEFDFGDFETTPPLQSLNNNINNQIRFDTFETSTPPPLKSSQSLFDDLDFSLQNNNHNNNNNNNNSNSNRNMLTAFDDVSFNQTSSTSEQQTSDSFGDFEFESSHNNNNNNNNNNKVESIASNDFGDFNNESSTSFDDHHQQKSEQPTSKEKESSELSVGNNTPKDASSSSQFDFEFNQGNEPTFEESSISSSIQQDTKTESSLFGEFGSVSDTTRNEQATFDDSESTTTTTTTTTDIKTEIISLENIGNFGGIDNNNDNTTKQTESFGDFGESDIKTSETSFGDFTSEEFTKPQSVEPSFGDFVQDQEKQTDSSFGDFIEDNSKPTSEPSFGDFVQEQEKPVELPSIETDTSFGGFVQEQEKQTDSFGDFTDNANTTHDSSFGDFVQDKEKPVEQPSVEPDTSFGDFGTSDESFVQQQKTTESSFDDFGFETSKKDESFEDIPKESTTEPTSFGEFNDQNDDITQLPTTTTTTTITTTNDLNNDVILPPITDDNKNNNNINVQDSFKNNNEDDEFEENNNNNNNNSNNSENNLNTPPLLDKDFEDSPLPVRKIINFDLSSGIQPPSQQQQPEEVEQKEKKLQEEDAFDDFTEPTNVSSSELDLNIISKEQVDEDYDHKQDVPVDEEEFKSRPLEFSVDPLQKHLSHSRQASRDFVVPANNSIFQEEIEEEDDKNMFNIPHPSSTTVADPSANNDQDFGDFGDFGDFKDDSAAATGGDFEDFGDFNETGTQNNIATTGDTDDFGDFGDFNETSSTPTTTTSTSFAAPPPISTFGSVSTSKTTFETVKDSINKFLIQNKNCFIMDKEYIKSVKSEQEKEEEKKEAEKGTLEAILKSSEIDQTIYQKSDQSSFNAPPSPFVFKNSEIEKQFINSLKLNEQSMELLRKIEQERIAQPLKPLTSILTTGTQINTLDFMDSPTTSNDSPTIASKMINIGTTIEPSTLLGVDPAPKPSLLPNSFNDVMSRIPDLTFMLSNKLSIPTKGSKHNAKVTTVPLQLN